MTSESTHLAVACVSNSSATFLTILASRNFTYAKWRIAQHVSDLQNEQTKDVRRTWLLVNAAEFVMVMRTWMSVSFRDVDSSLCRSENVPLLQFFRGWHACSKLESAFASDSGFRPVSICQKQHSLKAVVSIRLVSSNSDLTQTYTFVYSKLQKDPVSECVSCCNLQKITPLLATNYSKFL